MEAPSAAEATLVNSGTNGFLKSQKRSCNRRWIHCTVEDAENCDIIRQKENAAIPLCLPKAAKNVEIKKCLTNPSDGHARSRPSASSHLTSTWLKG